MEFNKNIRMVVDVDEVLTYIAPLWMSIMSKRYDYFGKYLLLPKDNFNMRRDFNLVLLRNKFDLRDSFGIYNDWKDGELEEFNNNFYSIIDNDSFYTKLCKPTKMAYTLKSLIDSSYLEKMYIVSRCLPHNKDGKRKFLEDFFGKNDKIDFHLLELHEKKSDYINKIGNIDVIIDDELSNVNDIIDNVKVKEDKGLDIYIPLLGYNIADDELINKVVDKNINVTYYEAIEGFNADTLSIMLESLYGKEGN